MFLPHTPSKYGQRLSASKSYQSKITKQKADSFEYHKIFNMWRMYDLWTTLFAIVGLSITIVNYEIDVWFFGIQTFYIEDYE